MWTYTKPQEVDTNPGTNIAAVSDVFLLPDRLLRLATLRSAAARVRPPCERAVYGWQPLSPQWRRAHVVEQGEVQGCMQDRGICHGNTAAVESRR